MRIGIIAISRSGGYNLGRWIANETGYKYQHEPISKNLDISGNNIVVKFLISEWNGLTEKPQMDKWIGLVREDIREQSVSLLRSFEYNEWHRPYTISDEWLNKVESDGEIERVINNSTYLTNQIQNEIPIIECQLTYEGLYQTGKDIQKVCRYLDIQNPKYLEMFNPKRRLRNWDSSNYKLI